MSKKKSKSAENSSKKAKIATSFPSLEDLLKNNRIRINGQQLSGGQVKQDPVYEELLRFYPKLVPEKQQLANLVLSGLSSLQSNPRAFGNLDYVDLLATPEMDSQGNRQDYYQTIPAPAGRGLDELQVIKLSPYESKLNPVDTLTHEGIHALDDLYTKTHQREILDFLAAEEGAGRIQPGRRGIGRLLKDAQAIIPDASFRQLYPYESFFRPKIIQDFRNINEQRPTDNIRSFTQARDLLKEEMEKSQDPGDSFMPLSELSAFGMENLFEPWSVEGASDPAKGLLLAMMRGVHRGFSDLGLNQHPLVSSAFDKRMAELGKQPVPPPLSSSSSSSSGSMAGSRLSGSDPRYQPSRSSSSSSSTSAVRSTPAASYLGSGSSGSSSSTSSMTGSFSAPSTLSSPFDRQLGALGLPPQVTPAMRALEPIPEPAFSWGGRDRVGDWGRGGGDPYVGDDYSLGSLPAGSAPPSLPSRLKKGGLVSYIYPQKNMLASLLLAASQK